MHRIVAVGVGAADALAAAKIPQAPLGVPAPVWLEALAVGLGFWGERVGIRGQSKDALLVSGLALAGARLTRVAMTGKLAAGPRAWGGDNTAAVGGSTQLTIASVPRYAPVASRQAATGLPASLAPLLPMQERAGTVG